MDEQICATKIKHSFRQYNPKKPNKWGYKLFVGVTILDLDPNLKFTPVKKIK